MMTIENISFIERYKEKSFELKKIFFTKTKQNYLFKVVIGKLK